MTKPYRHKNVISLFLILTWGVFCTFYGVLLPSNSAAFDFAKEKRTAEPHQTIVLADPIDPYYALAMKISQQESIGLVHGIEDAVNENPLYILWVVNPKRLSENRMIEIGEALQKHSSSISIGIITGTDMVSAEKLWKARLHKKDVFITVSEPGEKIFSSDPKEEIRKVSIEAIRHALQQANYLAFSGGGGPSFWRIDEKKTYFKQEHIPELSSIVVSSGGCQTGQIWKDNAIALKFIDQGAVGYAGFIFSPVPHTLFGFPDKFPFKLSWAQFPIGHIVSLQNKGLLQGFANFPLFYFFGDPRIYFNENAPYQVIDDHTEGGIRRLKLSLDQTGIIPIKLEEGAGYRFISVRGITSASEHDFFYNNIIQIMTVKNDKYILLNTDQKEIELSLHAHPPWYWNMLDPLVDSLDYMLFYIPQTTGIAFDAIVAGLALIITLLFCYKSHIPAKRSLPAILLGTGITLLYAVYAMFRMEKISTVSIPIYFDGFTLVVTFILVGCGALIFFNVRSWKGRLLALLIAAFPSWAVAAFWLGGLIAVNSVAVVIGLKSPIYNYNPGLMPLNTSLFCIALMLTLLVLLKKLQKRSRQMHE